MVTELGLGWILLVAAPPPSWSPSIWPRTSSTSRQRSSQRSAASCESEPGASLACVNVLKLSRVTVDHFEDEQGRNLHLRRLAELQHWARPLALDPDRITYHVVESPDPAAALLEYARSNRVRHLVMGARASSTLRRYLGSVSSRVVAEAPCTVTVVRTPTDSSVGPEAAGRPADST